MKKLLSLLATFGLISTGASTVVACDSSSDTDTSTVELSFSTTPTDALVVTGVTGKVGDDVKGLIGSIVKSDADTSDLAVGTTNQADYNKLLDANKADYTNWEKGMEVKAIFAAFKPAATKADTDTDVLETLKVYTVKITKEASTTTDLAKVTFTAVDNTVANNKAVTSDEATAAVEKVTTDVQTQLVEVVSGVTSADYTLDTTAIVASDLSAGVTVKITATTDSKLLTGTQTISVTFINASLY
ncbi:lipoprotein [Spiroplasma endosymbiont of Labia minor]|uniref:lipoprotein n=1 Tax=Spiroplasma endosymbiont of Labia minor TaxID=3066305 RepID=UPI0030D4949F